MGLQHVSFYKFCRLAELPELKIALRTLCAEEKLLGTILLSPEGVNGMATGADSAVQKLKTFLEQKIGVMELKVYAAPEHAFHRMLIKIKKEIISVGDSEVKPHENTAPRVSAKELKRWLDEGRKIILLDTRNDYEVEVGTFHGAKDLQLESSRDFSARVDAELPNLKQETVVTFCTGGIRCEKASAVLLKKGLKNVFQLDGGILRYLEENGSAHFDGNCFVFDWRLAVDGKLNPVARSAQEKQFGRHKT